MMKKIKISELDNQALLDLGLSKERHILFVDDMGIKKDNIPTLNELLRTREDFFINISSEKDESNKNYISGNDLLTALPEMRNLIYHASLKYPLKNISIFAKLINLRSLHLYGDLPKDMELKPLDNIENLESVYIENGLTLRQDVYLSMKSTIREIGAGTFRMESFDKNPNLKKIAVLTGVSHEEEMPKKLPELEELYINTNQIVALGVYELPNENGYEIGLMLNGERYTVYSVKGGTPELKKELQDNMRTIVRNIINQTKEEIVQVSIPKPDLTKYQKETLND